MDHISKTGGKKDRLWQKYAHSCDINVKNRGLMAKGSAPRLLLEKPWELQVTFENAALW